MKNLVKSTALYSLYVQKNFSCLIPKKNGVGYLKAAFGGHHINKESAKWNDNLPKIAGDICDIDGYLSISLKLNWWDDGYNEGIEEIKNTLSKIFPQIKEWKEIDIDEFDKILFNK